MMFAMASLRPCISTPSATRRLDGWLDWVPGIVANPQLGTIFSSIEKGLIRVS